MTILIATNIPMKNKDKLLMDVATKMHDLIDHTKDIKFIVNHKRLMIEYGDFIVNIRPAKYEKLAGIRYDYFFTDNPGASDYLGYHYRYIRSTARRAELNNTDDIIILFRAYLEELYNGKN